MERQIKIDELMIGDYVLTPHGIGCVESVYNGYTQEVSCQNISLLTEGLITYPISKINPFSPTSDFMAKNGFAETAELEYLLDEKRRIYLNLEYEVIEYKSEDGKNKFVLCECEYVHQLQHFLKLLNIDKEITT